MPKYDVYLKDPKANPFAQRLHRPVFRGIQAKNKLDVKLKWSEFSVGNDQFEHMEIDEIKAVD